MPTLVIGATHDTMDPEHMEWMAGEVAHGRFLLCPDGSHMAHIDDEEVYFEGLIRFLRDVDEAGSDRAAYGQVGLSGEERARRHNSSTGRCDGRTGSYSAAPSSRSFALRKVLLGWCARARR